MNFAKFIWDSCSKDFFVLHDFRVFYGFVQPIVWRASFAFKLLVPFGQDTSVPWWGSGVKRWLQQGFGPLGSSQPIEPAIPHVLCNGTCSAKSWFPWSSPSSNTCQIKLCGVCLKSISQQIQKCKECKSKTSNIRLLCLDHGILYLGSWNQARLQLKGICFLRCVIFYLGSPKRPYSIL